MPELSMQRRLGVVRFYFEGLPYGEIAHRAGVAKGTVANIISESKAGQFPQTKRIEEVRAQKIPQTRVA